MVVDVLHSSDILRGDDRGLPRTFFGNNAAQMDDAVAHDDVQAERAPVLLLECIDDAIADVVVVGGRVWNLAGQARYCLQKIGARDDADDVVSAHHRQTLDVILLHQLHDFLKPRIFSDGEGLRRHDLGDLATVFVNEISCRLAGAENQFQRSAALALRPDFATTNEITLRNHADKFTDRVNHWKPADMSLQHGVGGFDDRGLGCDGDDRPGHNLVGAHWGLRRFKIEFASGRLFQSADSDLTEIKGRPESAGLMQVNVHFGTRSYPSK